jgi:squalene-associated FAD-dependent desaturase
MACTRQGVKVTLFEAAPAPGGRARAIASQVDTLDNGQHILIGAYAECLRLMREVGLNPEHSLLRMPLSLVFSDGGGIRLPHWPAPLDLMAGLLSARGWSFKDKWSLLARAAQWHWQGFRCGSASTVADLCQGLSQRVMSDMMDPLCVSALNTPAARASGAVFLRVMHDALLGAQGSSNLLLPRCDLSQLWPLAAAEWLAQRGQQTHCSTPVKSISQCAHCPDRWQLNGTSGALGAFDRVVLACPPWESSRLMRQADGLSREAQAQAKAWRQEADGLRFTAITTVYAQGPASARLPQPMLALRSGPAQPAQFVFDRGALGGPPGLLAFVVSDSPTDDRQGLAELVLHQGLESLRPLGVNELSTRQVVVEKRATFACTPGLKRPGQRIASGLLACGDYCEGPYPATLEGAVRSGSAVGELIRL